MEYFPYEKLSGASRATLHRVFSCAMFSQLLRQFFRGIFLMHCCLEPLGYFCKGFDLCKVVPRVLRQIYRWFTDLMQCCLEPLGQHGIGFLPAQCCSKSIKWKFHRIFLCNVIWSLSDNIAYGFDLRNVVARVLRQHCTGIFLIQSCLEPLGQHCIGLPAVQCCPKSIKTIFFICNVVWSLLSNVAQSFDLCNVVPRVSRQNCTELFFTQCCLAPLGQHCIGFWPVQCYPKSTRTTLDRIFSYVMLSGVS